MSDAETAAALDVAAQMGIPVVTVVTHELENPAYVANAPIAAFIARMSCLRVWSRWRANMVWRTSPMA